MSLYDAAASWPLSLEAFVDIEEVGNKVRYTVTVPPVAPVSKLFSKKKRAKARKWAGDQIIAIQQAIEENLPKY